MASESSIEAAALALLDQALGEPSGAREAWIAAQDVPPDVKARAAQLLSADAAHAALRTGGAAESASESPLPDRIGAYRITSLIGQGGMGAVYRGDRAADDFEHVVAIKVIRPGALSGKLTERFLRERQTLARLVHPNIARLYDGGETEAGEPYIVMEHVEGRALHAWLDTEAPPLAARLDLFVAICDAVAYAHQNLVVHGDVTPSNVLVDANGQPRLIDFGIARAIAAEEATVDSGSRRSHSLTPGYAAPERLEGARPTTLADVFSLGRVLQELVADARNPELDAICARAIAALPAARYGTIEALRADVIAWRSGLPVQAVGGGWEYLLRKFVARHRLAVGAATSAIVLLLTAFGLALAANARAEAARAEAEYRFEQTRGIANTMLFDVYGEVSKVPGSTRAREVLARTGLQYLDALAADARAPRDLRVEVGRGYVRLAQVTGSGQQSQLGRVADANALLDKADAVLTRAFGEAPDDPKVRRALADLRIEQSGVNLYNNSEIALARAQAIETQRLLEPVARQDVDAARIYAVAIQAEGDSYGWEAEYERSLEPFARAEAFIARLPPEMRRDVGVMKVRSALLRLHAEAYEELNDSARALPLVTRAVEINEALARREPDSPEVMRKLAISLWYRATVLQSLRRDQDAYAAIDRAVALTRQSRIRDPSDHGALGLFAVVGEVRAMVLADLRRFREAYAMSEEVVAAHRTIVQTADKAPGPRRSFAATLKSVGGVYYNGGDYARACATWSEAHAIYDALERDGKLTGHDRTQALAEMQGWMRAACDPPRAGIAGGV